MASDDFLDELRATFMVEAQEHLATMSSALQSVQRAGSEPSGPRVETMFRAAHSLKGAARAVDLAEVEAVCEAVEEVVARWHRHGTVPGPAVQAALHQTLDALATQLSGDPAALGRPSAVLTARRRQLRELADAAPAPVQGLFARSRPEHTAATARVADAGPAVQVPPPAAATEAEAAVATVAAASTPHPAGVADTGDALVRVALAKLEAQLRQAEEMLAVKLAGVQRLGDWQTVADSLPQWQQALRRVQSDARRLRPRASGDAALARVLDFLEWSDRFVSAQARQVGTLALGARRSHGEAGRQIDALMDGARELFALPFATVAAPFARLVRELCREQGKEAQLVLRGERVELDRRVLQEIKDPLLHLLRNAVDHGVEPASVRSARGKPAMATLTLAAVRTEDQKVRITLTDDGKGLDAGRLRQAAVDAGLLSQADAAQLQEPAAYALVFLSGLSTAAAVTAVSGRGLGLAIVRERAERLGGDVQAHSRAGEGAQFTITLPARGAAFRGVLVQAGDARMLVPTTAVERVGRIAADAVQSVEGRDTVALGGEAVLLAELAQVLALPAPPHRPAARQVVVLAQGGQRLALAVDTVLDECEVLVKPLAWPLARVRNVAAAAVLGSGELVPVLHVGDLLRSARRTAGRAAWADAMPPVPTQPRAILLAEDSITSRMLLKSILESAGHQVVTAVDGADAWSKLHAGAFDLLVSDVEMPGLDGFDLTRRVRSDRRLAGLPVVLVTTLGTPQDAARGAQAGANAYIAKGSFDRSQLVDAVARLL